MAKGWDYTGDNELEKCRRESCLEYITRTVANEGFCTGVCRTMHVAWLQRRIETLSAELYALV
jgi:hypothetical protein